MHVCRRILWLHILCSFLVQISAYVAAGKGAAHDHNFVGSDETPLRNLQDDVAAQGEKMSTQTSRASSDRATQGEKLSTQAKMLEELLGRLEKQDSKFSELIAELNHKITEQDQKHTEDISIKNEEIAELNNKIAALREQDEKHAQGISIKNEEIAAQAIDLSALRERDVEREAQIATLKRRLQEREEDERRRALQNADRDDAYGAGGGGVKEAGVGHDGQPQSRRRATASTSDANLVKLRAESNKLVIYGDVDIKGDVVVRGRSYGSLLGAAPTPLPTLSGAPTESPTPRPSTPPTESPTPIPSTPRPSGPPTPSPTSFTYGK